jgi:ADP-heptose:LPS heptosyltransferase
MKILVVNLLRLGDFIQATPVIAAFRRQYTSAQIDVLTHTSERRLQPMLNIVDKWWTLNRDDLQAGLGRADIPLLTAMDVLKETLDEINAESYDLIVNLTHTAFSGNVVGYLNSKERIGLSTDVRGQSQFHSPWFRYLNEFAEQRGHDMFHYLDIFMEACELHLEARQWPYQETLAGKQELEQLQLQPDAEVVVCQVLTSDKKKNWSQAAWIECLNSLKQMNPRRHIVCLCAPSEAEQLAPLAAAVNAQVAMLSLEGALSLLKRAQLLLTGDTSIKHLANATNIKVIELSLGSSDYRRTGVYKADSLILQHDIPCRPCAHSSACTQTRHLCAEQLSASWVAKVVDAKLRNDEESLKKLDQTTHILRTRSLQIGFWFAGAIVDSNPIATVNSWLNRCTWRFWLNQNHKMPVATYGSETVKIENELTDLFPVSTRQPMLAHLDFLEKSLIQPEAKTVAGTSMDFVLQRSVQRKNQQELAQNEIKVKLVRSLKTRLMEKS